MSDSSITLSNAVIRRLSLSRQGLAQTPCGQRKMSAFVSRISSLGMVQLDSIGILARAHHHILWSRQSAYRQPVYHQLLQQERAVFEHFSHDAVILPMSTYPYWQRQQARRAERYRRAGWKDDKSNRQLQRCLLSHIEKHGPVCSRDLSRLWPSKPKDPKPTWGRPRHKIALDYLWLGGELSVSHRHNFTKYYDLTERVIPDHYSQQLLDEPTQVNWLCEQALLRLGVASASEIQRFWDACDLSEVQAWLKQPSLPLVDVQYADSSGQLIKAIAPANIEDHLAPVPSSRLRILSPFDPAVRDRQRLKRLFGFDYRIEIYVPAQQRQYGYYVYPILEGERFIGRIDVRANRATDALVTRAWWLEPGVRDTEKRRMKIRQELTRLAKLAEVSGTDPLPERSPIPLGIAK